MYFPDIPRAEQVLGTSGPAWLDDWIPYVLRRESAASPTLPASFVGQWHLNTATGEWFVSKAAGGDKYDWSKVGNAAGTYNADTYGIKGDDSTDNSAKINEAITALNAAGGGILFFPPGIYRVNTAITLRSDVKLVGSGRGVTTIKLNNGRNTDVMTGLDAYTLFGDTDELGVMNFGVTDLTVDGNMANQSPADPDLCNGIVVYGAKFDFSRINVINVKGHGLRTEWQQYGEPNGGLEGVSEHVTVDRCGRRAWWHKGPHDIAMNSFIWIDAGQEADNTWDGFYQEGFTGGRYHNLHGWHRGSTTNRVRAQMYVANGGSEYNACHFEGGRRQMILGPNALSGRFNNCFFYAPYGATDLVLLQSSQQVFTGCRFDNTAGLTAAYAVSIGDVEHTVSATQFITCNFNDFGTNSPINFANDGGGSIIIGSGQAGAGASTGFAGTINTTSTVIFTHRNTPVWNVTQVGAAIKADSASRNTVLGYLPTMSGSPTDAVNVGRTNTISANGGVAVGNQNSVSASNGTALGTLCQAAAFATLALGYYARTTVAGEQAFASWRQSAVGDRQFSRFAMAVNTTNDTPTEMSCNTPDSTLVQLVLENNSVLDCVIEITGVQNNDLTKVYRAKYEGAIKRAATANTTAFVNSGPSSSLDAGNPASWATAVSADTSTGALKITVTGVAATNISWFAEVRARKMKF